MAKGQRALENQVSRTSGSCTSRSLPQLGQWSGGSTQAKRWPSAQVLTGMAWPSQIWRLMHQSRMPRIQVRNWSRYRSGWKLTSPLSTAAMAGAARVGMRTHHCSLTSGSMTWWQRSQWLTSCT